MLTFIKSKLRRFRREEEGAMVVEAMIMFPTLFACVIATFVFFDAFRNQSINLKAAYTISDALSREDQGITNTFITNTWLVHRFLTNSEALTKLRVTLVKYVDDTDDEVDNGEHIAVWSVEKGGAGTLTDAEVQMMNANNEIPVMPDGETLILVQTWVDYEPNFSIGLGAFTFENTIFTRPRAAANGVCYDHNGVPDGDDICPVGGA
ncbi:Flp pilus assembly protein TadG [Octadecabacter temperatus]|uniref:Uncharacterized protein n=1 Tax=Octadecabacter temperatus TaxID=1458307 RepID=A0A0K0Y790_9RHOB|nr:hypothetical protein [Octadecabacter temperatus]AKS46790.1 hypothetical protein OSB_22530 [Octadecabacter temperatus]SIO21275.1 Flp pilus assembly protein TadG [Octadecabacter temperatus]